MRKEPELILPEGNAPEFPNRLIPFIWYFARQMKWYLLGVGAFAGIAHGLNATLPYFLKIFAGIFEKYPPTEAFNALMVPFLAFTAVTIALTASFYLSGWFKTITGPALTNTIRYQLALFLQGHSYAFFQRDFSGRLANEVIDTPTSVREVVELILGPIWYAFITFSVSLLLFGTAHWIFGTLMIAWLTVYMFFLHRYTLRIKDYAQTASRSHSDVTGRFVDIISNILLVKLFAMARKENRYLHDALDENTRHQYLLDKTVLNMNGVLLTINAVFYIATIGFMVFGWQMELLSASDAAMILPLMLQVASAAGGLSEIFANFFEKVGEVTEGIQVLNKAHEITDKPDAQDLKVTEGRIEFDTVSFAYEKNYVFRNFSLFIPAGQKVGLVGSSGAGKSTLISLLLRLYDTDSGTIAIDGQSIRDVRQNSLRSQISVIPQNCELFHRSVAENILCGSEDYTREQVIDAAKTARAHEFILQLEDVAGRTGYDAHVGERGVRLSGGQRQRIAIARAILKNSSILILDEATSALDSESERLIKQALDELMVDKTVIAIAHRLSTLQQMDRILVLEAGQIIEDGPHEDLINRPDGHYAHIWKMQSGGMVEEQDESSGRNP